MKRILTAFVIVFASITASAQEEYQRKVFTSADGTELNYRLLTPEENAKGKKFPLVIFLHGAGE